MKETIIILAHLRLVKHERKNATHIAKSRRQNLRDSMEPKIKYNACSKKICGEAETVLGNTRSKQQQQSEMPHSTHNVGRAKTRQMASDGNWKVTCAAAAWTPETEGDEDRVGSRPGSTAAKQISSSSATRRSLALCSQADMIPNADSGSSRPLTSGYLEAAGSLLRAFLPEAS